MEQRKMYLSGPITGVPGARDRFAAAASAAEELGFVPVNPFNNGLPDGALYKDHMRADLRAMTDCNAVLMLDGWKDSAGARVELTCARAMGLRVYYLEAL